MYFPSNMAPCHDKITNSVIKDAPPYILPVLTDIVNRSLLSTVFSSDAILPVASKVCERITLNQLTTYMSNKKRLTGQQKW